jgi:hypothetical protein
MRNAYKILVGRPDRKRLFERLGLPQDRDQWRALAFGFRK